MTSLFSPEYAAVYDSINANKDYEQETTFVLETIGRGQKRLKTESVLDLGCGTGRHLIHFEPHFDFVAGVDRSSGMLEVAKGLLPRASLTHGDVGEINLGRTFDVVTALFDVLSYQVSNVAVFRFFESIARHLAPQGLAVVDFWHLAGLISDPPTTRMVRGNVITDSELHFVRYSCPSVDWTSAVTTVAMATMIWRESTLQAMVEESHQMRAFQVNELGFAASLAGLEIEESGGWLRGPDPTEADWHAYVMMRHKE